MKRFIFFILILISAADVKAQFYTPAPMTINTPYGPVHSTHYVYTPGFYNYGGASNPKYEFTVQLKNDSMITLKSRMQAEKKKLYLEYKEKKEKIQIFPSETKGIIGIGFGGVKMLGIPADSCWLFTVKVGAIYCFSTVPTADINATMAIRKEATDPIVGLTKENLQEMVEDIQDEKIAKWLEKKNFVKVIQRYNKLKAGKK